MADKTRKMINAHNGSRSHALNHSSQTKIALVSLVTSVHVDTNSGNGHGLPYRNFFIKMTVRCTLNLHRVNFFGMVSLEEIKIQITSFRDASIPRRVLFRLLSYKN